MMIDQVTYHCSPGFDLVGRANRYCQADGTWTPSELPICVRKFHLSSLYLDLCNDIPSGEPLGGGDEERGG